MSFETLKENQFQNVFLKLITEYLASNKDIWEPATRKEIILD